MRKLDLNQPATDARIYGYIEVRPSDGETPRHEVPLWESVDPNADTVRLTGEEADALTDKALIGELVAALDALLVRSMTNADPDYSEIDRARDVLAKARACGHG